MTDEYRTIATISEGYYTEKRSKFLAFAHHVETIDEVKGILRAIARNTMMLVMSVMPIC